MRLVVVLLLFVVLPTAILSLVAGHSIQSRELILRQRLENRAIRQIKSIGDQFNLLIEEDTAKVIGAFRETVLSGKHSDCMEQKLESLQSSSNFIKGVYLFMNPWNFIFPPEQADLSTAVSLTVLLKQELIRQISIGLKDVAPNVSFFCERSAYSFKPVPNMPELYAGFEIDIEKVVAKLQAVIGEWPAQDIFMRISAINGDLIYDLHGDVLITDSFSPQGSAFDQPMPAFYGAGEVLVRGVLPAPLVNIEISAFLVDEAGIGTAEALESRLIKWGILLLAIVIVASAVILIKKTMNQALVARKRSEFVIGMSHDLRTPVAAMRVLADSLVAGRVEDPEKQKKFLKTISSECEKLGDMIERVLFFFKQEHGAISYTMHPFDIGAMVRKIVHSVEARSAGKMVIALEVDGELPEVIGDVEALGKVITNLLDNALKYGERFGSGAPPWLEYANTHTRPAEEHQNLRLEFEAERLEYANTHTRPAEEHQNLRLEFEDERLEYANTHTRPAEEHQNLRLEFEAERLEYADTHTRPSRDTQNFRSEFEDERLKGASLKSEMRESEHRTSNIQHRTSNDWRSEDGRGAEGVARTHKGSPCSVHVFVERWRWRDWVVISVADGGMGIAVSEQKKIFKRFYRVSSDTHSHVGGIGLGLSLCADIVRAHRGRITVKSELGKGSEFSVWLASA